ncbi:MAG: transglutaminase family protein [Acidobacteriaceae bacterium]
MNEPLETLAPHAYTTQVGTAPEPDRELRSLFSLLDDPDERIAAIVMERILARIRASSWPGEVIGPLATLAKTAENPLARRRAERLAIESRAGDLALEFEALSPRLAAGHRRAFEDGLLLIARFANPLLDSEAIRAELDSFAHQLNYRLAGRLSALEVLDEVNHFFFEELRFRGNQAKFLEPENSYIDWVVDRRIGIPISLASVYLLVTRIRLGLPFSGASAPGHFLVRYDGLAGDPLFIDAFNSGVILRERDIRLYLTSSGLPYHRQFLDPAPPRAILLRMIRNLIIVFTEHENIPARKAFERFMTILAPDAKEGQAFLRGLEN